jgi:hypothetical protein
MENPYRFLPPAPGSISCGAIISRLLDGIGFRYHWATEGLADADMQFSPAPGSMNLGELLRHIHALLHWVGLAAGMAPEEGPMPFADGIVVRARTLALARELSGRFGRMTDGALAEFALRTDRGDRFPFWNILNGPLADSLTHIGQVVSWRRILGKPVPQADVFRGLPPKS